MRYVGGRLATQPRDIGSGSFDGLGWCVGHLSILGRKELAPCRGVGVRADCSEGQVWTGVVRGATVRLSRLQTTRCHLLLEIRLGVQVQGSCADFD